MGHTADISYTHSIDHMAGMICTQNISPMVDMIYTTQHGSHGGHILYPQHRSHGKHDKYPEHKSHGGHDIYNATWVTRRTYHKFKFLSTSFSFLMYISCAICVECWKVKHISSLDEIDIDSRLIPWRQCRISPYKDVVS